MIPEADMVALSGCGLEPLVEEVGGAHGHEADEGCLLALREPREVAGETEDAEPVARVERRDVGRDDPEDRLDEAGHVRHQLAVLLVRVGVAGGSSGGSRASSGRGRRSARASRPGAA